MTSCVNNSNCPSSNPICNTTTGLCTQCNSTQDCKVGYSCVETKCIEIPPCGEDINCSRYPPYTKCQPITDGSSGMCVECVQDANCTYFQRCQDGRCIPSDNSPKPCLDGCDRGYSCMAGFCQKIDYKYQYVAIIGIIEIGVSLALIRKK